MTSVSHAARGLGHALWPGANFRIQLVLGASAIALLAFCRPAVVWWVFVFVAAAGVLSAELFNTALESVCDAVHPDQHPLIGSAKDCAAAAVMIWSLFSRIVLAALLFHLAA